MFFLSFLAFYAWNSFFASVLTNRFLWCLQKMFKMLFMSLCFFQLRVSCLFFDSVINLVILWGLHISFFHSSLSQQFFYFPFCGLKLGACKCRNTYFISTPFLINLAPYITHFNLQYINSIVASFVQLSVWI